MSELIITPDLATEAALRNKPALLTVSKLNISFNLAATKRLALKQGNQFQLIIRDRRIFYKDVPKNGFIIRTVNDKGSSINNRGLHLLISENYKKSDKSFRFKIGDFEQGLRELTLEG